MPDSVIDMFTMGTLLQISGLLGLGLFFVVIGVREIREDRPEGYLYLTVALFLSVAHAVLLDNLLSANSSLAAVNNLTVWLWLVALFAPALTGIFLLRALFNFAVSQGRDGLVKLFFGLTLLCYIYMIGAGWPMDVRGILTLIWVGFLFKTEIAIAS